MGDVKWPWMIASGKEPGKEEIQEAKCNSEGCKMEENTMVLYMDFWGDR